MANDKKINWTHDKKQTAITVLAVILALLVALAFMRTIVEPEVITKTKNVTVPAEINKSEWVPMDDYNKTIASYNSLKLKYADDEREFKVEELAKLEIEDNYIKDLDLDEDEYNDYEPTIAWVNFDLDDDDDDYFVTADFLVMLYDEDGNVDVDDILLANATMEVEDDDDVDDLEINWVV